MRVAIDKRTGRILEGQSNDDLPFDDIRGNVLRRGHAEGDVEFTTMPDAYFHAAIAAQNFSAMNYCEKRRREYPSVGDQLDALWKGGAAAEEMRAKVLAVKAKYSADK